MASAQTLVNTIKSAPAPQALYTLARDINAHMLTLGSEGRRGERIGSDAYEEVEICKLRRQVDTVNTNAFTLQQDMARHEHDALIEQADALTKKIEARRAKVADALQKVAPIISDIAQLERERQQAMQAANFLNTRFALERRTTGSGNSLSSPRHILDEIARAILA